MIPPNKRYALRTLRLLPSLAGMAFAYSSIPFLHWNWDLFDTACFLLVAVPLGIVIFRDLRAVFFNVTDYPRNLAAFHERREKDQRRQWARERINHGKFK